MRAHTFVDSAFAAVVSDALRSAGIAADPFVSSQLTGALFTIPEPDRENGAILIDCGGQHCDVSLIYDNGLCFAPKASESAANTSRVILHTGCVFQFGTAESIKRR